ncbi:MAG TPA: sigma-70 family RNA polymerase sigma factor [Polyangiales bacterium]|nr:sigma-70 family RNA polymerase sigma factor [Polyangiales bacterium]
MNKAPQSSASAATPLVAASSTAQDSSLARYMTELSGYELLTHADEIALAKDVESLEIAYWQALMSRPRAHAIVRDAITPHLEAVPREIQSVARAVRAASASKALRADRARYERAVQRLAVKLREADLHREAIKAVHAAVLDYAEQELTAIGKKQPRKAADVKAYLHEVQGARRAQQDAKDRFVAANLRLVVSMARRYAREGRMPLGDLIQEGNLGLMKAVERFDHRRGFRFSTYASWWIRHALTRGLADKGRLVRLPVHALEARARLSRVARKLTSQTGIAPNLAELAAETGLAPDKVSAIENLSTESHSSLDAPVGHDGDRTFVDLLKDEDQTSVEERMVQDGQKESLAGLMGELTTFEAQILRYRYGFDDGEERTLKEIGDMYNLSRERIRQIQAFALEKMRARVSQTDLERAAL